MSWNPEDTDYLNSLSVDEYKTWMKNSPEDMSYKIKKGLLMLDGEISDKTNQALKLIADEPSANNFNAFRIKKIYKIE